MPHRLIPLAFVLALASSACPGERCDTEPFAFQDFCLPRTVPKDTTFVAKVGSSCGGCGTEAPTCTVDDSRLSSEGVLVLEPVQTVCDVTGRTCPAICRLDVATCELPALAVGTYTVVFNGDTQRLVEVVDGAGETDCDLQLF